MAFGLAFCGPAIAEEPSDLTIADDVKAGASPDMPFIRCGAFYYAHLWWDSARPFLSDAEKTLFDANMKTALTQGNFIRSEKSDGGVDAINESIKSDLRHFITAYVKRFERNRLADAPLSDALVRADAAFCSEFVPS